MWISFDFFFFFFFFNLLHKFNDKDLKESFRKKIRLKCKIKIIVYLNKCNLLMVLFYVFNFSFQLNPSNFILIS